MDGGSMRVPNRGWDETPRGRGAPSSSGGGRRGWDETPRGGRSRGGSPEEMLINGKEWEEEQVRLDRDWYSYDDEGAVVSGERNLCPPRLMTGG
jgi:pre-mRNA-splicing factor ATP-dependent RNA helicase DHX38/PRP16